jgi:hypothetical protein
MRPDVRLEGGGDRERGGQMGFPDRLLSFRPETTS